MKLYEIIRFKSVNNIMRIKCKLFSSIYETKVQLKKCHQPWKIL